MYKIMNAEELTELIATTEVGKEISFAYDWDESKPVDELEDWEVSCWYGFKKVKAIDSIYVIMDYYGGGCDRCYNMLRNDYGATLLEFVTEYLNDWVHSDTVCVELDD
jgi:hypothetical protein